MADRKHAKAIRKWLDNPDSTVWYYSPLLQKWDTVSGDGKNPHFLKGFEYRVVLPEYAEAWQAYLDGEMEVSFNGENWYAWSGDEVPMFSDPPERYRRKPVPSLQMKIVILEDGVEQERSYIIPIEK